jgi:mycothiol synthase
MAIQTKFKSRPNAGEADLQPICDLLNLCNEVDKLEDEPYAAVDDTRRWLDSPELDQARDVRMWEDEAGRLVGLGIAWIAKEDDENGEVDSHLFFRVHPDARNTGLETQIIDWASERVREVGRERGKKAHLRSGLHYSSPEYIAYRRGILEEHGFAPVRYGYKMARPLDEPLPKPEFPEGFTMRHAQGEADIEPWVEMFNLSFIDHWNFHPETVEAHKHWLESPKYDPKRNLIAIAPDGTFAAFCFCWIDPEDNEKRGRNEGWIDILGTRRGFRKIGLGRAMLLAGMHKLKADGVDTAVLGVDAENPTGALRLYESVGFKVANKGATYHKDL